MTVASSPVGAKPRRAPRSAVAPIRLVARGNDRISVAGLHTFLDTVRLGSAGNGIVVVNELPLERYVLGLNEVPPEWPLEALKAQAVAARTYALWTLLRPPTGDAATYGFDICATVECQVFSGADVLALPEGHRWVQAVSDTAGEAILYKGGPILARYHSTSGGRTFNNEDVFYGEPAYPYLKSVPSPWETPAPLWRWQVRFTVENVQAMLERVGWWGPDFGKLVSVRSLPPPSRNGLSYPDLRFKGKKGAIVRFGDDFRTIARELAPAMFPGVYPSAGPIGPLPETLPSERFNVATRGGIVTFNGRGWGHGTGMSQWGAHGLALLGRTYRDILAHYYRNTSVGSLPYPGEIGVGVGWGLSSVTASGAFRIVDGRGRTLVDNATGTWRFRWTGGNTLAIDPGTVGPPLPDVKTPRKLPVGPSSIRVRILDAPETVVAGKFAVLSFAISQAARVTTVTSQATRFSDLNVRLAARGRGRIRWMAPSKPGRYRVRVEATSQTGAGVSRPVRIRVRAAGAADASAGRDGGPLLDETGASVPLAVSALALLIVVGVAVAAVTIELWPMRRPSKTR